MGAACCVASREKTITNASNSDLLHRNIRHSPTWSFRWDHRGRVAGEETSMSWFSDAASRNDGSESKLESAYVSEEGSPLDNFRRPASSQKSSVSEVTAGHVRTSASDRSVRRNASSSMDASMDQSKELTESPSISYPSPAKLSGSLPSTSSLATSPLSSQGLVPPASSTTSRWPRHSPGHPLLRQVSDSRIPVFRSPNSYPVAEERPVFPSWTNESTWDSRGGSSDSWSMNAFSELMANSRRERWSFESESFGFNREKMARASSRISTSPCVDLQSCGICSKLVTERSLWSGQKIFACNELSVVAVLMCGHVYHAECLERMTPEINKYDPACPICTFGEKQTHKMCEKALKAEIELKARNRRSRSQVVDLDGDPIMFDRFKGSENQGSPKMASSSSTKVSSGKPFLKKHFSFGSKSSRAGSTDNYPPRKKGLFWAKYSKM